MLAFQTYASQPVHVTSGLIEYPYKLLIEKDAIRACIGILARYNKTAIMDNYMTVLLPTKMSRRSSVGRKHHLSDWSRRRRRLVIESHCETPATLDNLIG